MITALKIIEVLAFIFSAMSAIGLVCCAINGTLARSELAESKARKAGVKNAEQLIISIVIALVIHHYI